MALFSKKSKRKKEPAIIKNLKRWGLVNKFFALCSIIYFVSIMAYHTFSDAEKAKYLEKGIPYDTLVTLCIVTAVLWLVTYNIYEYKKILIEQKRKYENKKKRERFPAPASSDIDVPISPDAE